MFLASIVLLGWLQTTPVVGYDPVGDYYQRLRVECETATNPACCRASVREMRKQQARVAEAGIKCPPGFRRASMRCPSSYNWCAYKAWSPEQIRRRTE